MENTTPSSTGKCCRGPGRVPGGPQPKAILVLGFHLLGVSLPALQVNLRNHLAHPPWPGNATTMHMEPNSSLLAARRACGSSPADARGPRHHCPAGSARRGPMWFGCGLSPWGAGDSQGLGRSFSSGVGCRGGESRAAFPGCFGRDSGKLPGNPGSPGNGLRGGSL